MEDLLERISIPQAARLLGISKWTVRAWVRERRLPFYKVGGRIVFDRKEVESLLDRARVEPLPGKEIA